ncbi:MAG TPA: aminotransferase class I/II-fold pyridoxal phosphate-dependent enzyme [Solirubrobacteraceae bacterium]|nr:aminotransferase class I/II-fold pyridoxal phosphate-dependent enzyme [Solirubrobacteraceae bacterium]
MTDPLVGLSLDELRRRTSAKWRRYPPDVLPLWVAEMDTALAPPIADALTEAVAIGDTGYPEGSPYAEAFAQFASRRWGWDFEVAACANVPDVMMGIVEVLKLVTGTGDPVVINSPVYPPFYGFVRYMDRRVIEAPLNAEHRIDLAALDVAFAGAVTGGRRAAFLLCSPHNPTGTVHTSVELSAVAKLAERHGVRVVVDEIHAPIVYPESPHVPYLSLAGTESGFALLSATKAWNLAGLKAALAVAGPGATEDLARLPQEVRHGPSHFGIIAQVAALRHGGRWLDDLLGGLDANRRLLAELLAEHLPAVRYRRPQGTYLAWLDCRALSLPDDPAAVFLERGRVALNSGSSFGTGGAGHVRLNLATSAEILGEAVARMASAVR